MPHPPTSISAGGEHSLFLHGTNLYSAGACGLSWNRSNSLSPNLFGWRKVMMSEPIAFMAAGYYHNLAVGANTGNVFSWGCGTFLEGSEDGCKPALGQGLKALDVGGLPKQVSLFEACKGRPVSLAAGAYHSVIMTDKNKVFTFGNAQLGQLGRSNIGVAKDSSGLPVDPIPKEVDGLFMETPVEIGAGFYNTYITTRSGKLYCTGENQNRQCGREKPFNVRTMLRATDLKDEKIRKAEGGYCHTLALTLGGKLLSMGCGDDGQRGDGFDYDGDEELREIVTSVKLPGKVVKFAAGANHSVAVCENGSAFAWGSNEFGQCSAGKSEKLLAPQRINIQGEHVASISCGYAHTMVKTKTGKVYMFGQNENGQLGLGEKFANRPKDVLDATEIIINK
ncbi:hypothetical protein TL16_g07190 [Triparma laevis f. inornata]|uniref:RCC1-like domain-containing protein n=2 Tax=Triparma laevis TaxID=1534972 RepID=A0A9W6ZF45_9STRA|nr:hypothetical protein TrLO_g4679 [Triparma laevis f. longispina]GMH76774.1 hypothetical protein TL16_g07190 [Triparma laevis f. inornata]